MDTYESDLHRKYMERFYVGAFGLAWVLAIALSVFIYNHENAYAHDTWYSTQGTVTAREPAQVGYQGRVGEQHVTRAVTLSYKFRDGQMYTTDTILNGANWHEGDTINMWVSSSGDVRSSALGILDKNSAPYPAVIDYILGTIIVGVVLWVILSVVVWLLCYDLAAYLADRKLQNIQQKLAVPS